MCNSHSTMAQSHLDKPREWTTGSDPPTWKQTAFLNTLAKEKGVEVDLDGLNKGDASAKINALKGLDAKDVDANAPQEAAAAGKSRSSGENGGEPIQDPSTWATGDEAATSRQRGYIAVMAREAGEEGPGEERMMGKREASSRIEALKGRTGM